MYFSLIFSLIGAPSHIVKVMHEFYHSLKNLMWLLVIKILIQKMAEKPYENLRQ